MNSINNQFKIDTDQFLSFVLPTFNESENIILLLDELLSNFGDFQLELIVIDDNSSDGTHNLVRERAKKDSRIRLINRLDRSGLSSAIKEGCLNASGEIIAIMDTDGQHQVSVMKDAIKKCPGPEKREHVHLNFYNYSTKKAVDINWCPINTLKCPRAYRRPDLIEP